MTSKGTRDKLNPDVPAHNDGIVETITFHMLQSPSFIESPWHQLLCDPAQLGRMIQPEFDLFWKCRGKGRDE